MKKKVIIGILIIICFIGGFVLFTKQDTTKKSTTPNYKGNYIALGDSVAAGVGLMNYSDSSACDRTEQSYPKLVAQSLKYKVTNLACTGATLSEGILGSQNVNELQVTPQLQALLEKPKPNIITITIGANDAQWTTILGQCYTSECGRSVNQVLVNSTLLTITENLNQALDQIKAKYSDPPKVIVTGYYQVFPLTIAPDCSDLTGIDVTEIAVGRKFQTQLNAAIESSVDKYAFATFAPISFAGHELCTTDPWIQGLNDQQPYHPTKEGQAAYAKQIMDIIKKSQ